MTFGREKRLWLGALALLVPIPLPFNQVLEWPFLFVYALLVIHFIQRAERGAWLTLGNWALNLLGLFYLPIFYFDLRAAFHRGSAVTALLHLILFLLLVKLYSIRREKDKWHILVAVYFLFVGAMATSSHVSIAPYLLACLVASLLVLGRFAHLHMAAAAGGELERAAAPPFGAPVALGTLLVLLVAVPLFATMPRIREPYILGRGTASGGMARTTGFSDSVDLSLTSSIRGNRSVALRIQYDDVELVGVSGNLRFKGATYDRYARRNWYRTLKHAQVLVPKATATIGRHFQVGSDETAINRATIFLQPINSFSLILPVETVSIEADRRTSMGIDPGGAVILPVRPNEPVSYQVGLAREPVIHARLDEDPESELSALDRGGLTPRMIELARQVMGEGSAEERIDRLEQHLLTQYAYTLDYLGRTGESPLEDFLFVYQSGHCEFFASAMVLMLRSQGIPARFVTGFLGAELNPLEGYYVVRQQNAHAWVEAYSASRGWRIYDPTPPDGRPVVAPQSLALLLTQVYDYVTFRWDRYVLTYGAEDQEGFFRKLRQRLRLFWGRVQGRGEEEAPGESPSFDVVTATEDDLRSPWVWQPRMSLLLLVTIFAAAVAAQVAWNRRRPLSGETAYRRLRSRLERTDLEVSDSLPPLELLASAAGRFPPAEGALRQVVGRYVRESFAEDELSASERRGLREALRSVEEVLKEERRRERRAKRGKRPRAAAA